MFFVSKDNLKEIFIFLGFAYFPLLKCINKEWKEITNEIKIKKNFSFQIKYRKCFYSLVNDFVSRDDFEKLNIYFIFKNYDLFYFSLKFGLLNIVKYLHEQNPISKRIKTKDNQETEMWDKQSCVAAKYGYLDVLKYLHKNNYPLDKECSWNASLNGHLHIIKYLQENNCPWDEWSCHNAAWNGHLHILKYLHENNCPWDDLSCRGASENGHLHILKYLNENKCPYDKQDCLDVAENNEIKEYIEKFM